VRARLEVLARDEIEAIHRNSLRILAELGVKVHSPLVLEALRAFGAEVKETTEQAFLPEEIVKRALQAAPREIRLGARDPEHDLVIPTSGPPFAATNGLAVTMTDLETGKPRGTTGTDLGQFATVADALEGVDYFWPIVTAGDVPARAHEVHEIATSLCHTTKHIQGDATSGLAARLEVEIGTAVAGDRDALRRRPLFSVVQCPICPLEFEHGSVEAQAEFAKAGIPIVAMSMALCGFTAPVTFAGTLSITHAENLASVTISQAIREGAPVIYSCESMPPDMKTGEINYGVPEEALIGAAAAQMGRSLGLPTMAGGFGVRLREETPGLPRHPQVLFTTALTTFNQTDLLAGIGGLDRAKGASLEQVIIDTDLWETIKPHLRAHAVDPETLAYEVIEEMAPTGTFLRHPHTTRHLRKELWLETGEAARRHARYGSAEEARIVAEARVRVREILKTHRAPPLDAPVRRRVEEILLQANRQLA